MDSKSRFAKTPKRQRITITLENEDLEILDWCIKENRVGNRANMAWFILTTALPPYSKALLRARATGRRLDAMEIFRAALGAICQDGPSEAPESFQAGELAQLSAELENIQAAIKGAGPVIARFATNSRERLIVEKFRKASRGEADHLKPVPPQ